MTPPAVNRRKPCSERTYIQIDASRLSTRLFARTVVRMSLGIRDSDSIITIPRARQIVLNLRAPFAGAMVACQRIAAALARHLGLRPYAALRIDVVPHSPAAIAA